MLDFHRERKNHLTVLGVIKKFTVPYGVINLENEELNFINEKPDFHFLINTGVYIIEPALFSLLSEPKFLSMTDLILLAKKEGFKIGVYPYHGQWFDIGQWEEYHQALKYFSSSF